MRISTPILFLVSGLLFGIPFVFSFLFWCIVPAFILFLYAIQHTRSRSALFGYGTLVGTLHYAGAFYWVWSTFPIQWMAEASYSVQLLAIGSYWVLTSLAMGVCSGFFALVAKELLLRSSYVLLSVMPFVWVLSEILRSFFFSVYAYGPGSFLNIGFSYGYVGYLLAEVPSLLSLSNVAGVYGLSYLAALLGAAGYLCVSKKVYLKKKVLVGILVVTAIVLFFPVHLVHHNNETVGKKVVVFEAWFDHTFLEEDIDGVQKKVEIEEAMKRALLESPDVVVLPEDARFSNSFASPEAFWEWVRTFSLNPEVIIIDNGPMVDARGVQVLRAYMYDAKTESAYAFDKQYLVPQGEFMSALHTWILSLTLSDESFAKALAYARFEPGVIRDSHAYPAYLPGILFCFETMVPYGVLRAESVRNPDFIAHPISHAWFVNPFSLETQLHQMLKISAVWNDVPIVSAGSMTESYLYLPTGEQVEGQVIAEDAHWKLKVFEL